MELCPQEKHPKNENLETLEELSRDLQQISDSYFEMQGKTFSKVLSQENYFLKSFCSIYNCALSNEIMLLDSPSSLFAKTVLIQFSCNLLFCFLVKAAILNVEIGTLFDPEIASKLKQSEETCVKCSQRINDFVEKPVEFANDKDVEMK